MELLLLLFSEGKGLKTVKPFIFVELFMFVCGSSLRYTLVFLGLGALAVQLGDSMFIAIE